MSDRIQHASDEDKTFVAIIYGLYLAGFLTLGLTTIAGIVLAHVRQPQASEAMRSHYTFAIRTFWISVVASIAAGLLMVVSFPLMLILIGFLLMPLAWVVLTLVGVWFAVRCIIGIVYLSRGEGHPRPYAWLA